MLLLAFAASALACGPDPTYLAGFHWLEDAIDVPTDAWLPVATNRSDVLVTLERVDTGEVVPTSVARWMSLGGHERVLLAPAAPLAAHTTYLIEADLPYDDGEAPVATTFSTGAGLAPSLGPPVGVDAPVATGWVEDLTACSLGEPYQVRTVSGEVTLPEGLVEGTSLVFSVTGEEEALYAIVPVSAGESSVAYAFEQWRVGEGYPDQDLDCAVPSLLGPNGVEVIGEEICVVADASMGAGCATAPSAASSAVVLLGLLGCATRRRRVCTRPGRGSHPAAA